MFEYVDGEDPIERVVIPGESLLAIGDDNRQTFALRDLSRELIRCLESNILPARFELNVRPSPRPDLQRSQRWGGRASRKGVVEPTHPSKP